MKWPFVRRSKYELLVKKRDEQKRYKELWEEKSNNLLMSNTSNLVEINRLNKEKQALIEDIGKVIKDKNRIFRELENEMNSHREKKECFEYTINGLKIHNNNLEKELEETKEGLHAKQVSYEEFTLLCMRSEENLRKEIKETKEKSQQRLDAYNCLFKELEETKEYLKKAQEHEQKLFEAHDKLNQQNMGLLYEVEEWKKALDYWMGKAATSKSEILKVRGYLKTIAKKL